MRSDVSLHLGTGPYGVDIAGAEGLGQLDAVPVGEAKQRMVAAFRGDVVAAAAAWAAARLSVSSGMVSARDLDHTIDYAGFTGGDR